MSSFLLCGLSGSGKSTTAAMLGEKFGLSITEQPDVIHTKLRKNYPYLFGNDEDVKGARYKLLQYCTKIIQSVEIILESQGKDIIIDSSSLTASTRNFIQKCLPKAPIIIHVTCSEETLKKRLQERAQPGVWLALYEQQLQNFQPPHGPNVIVYDTKKDTPEDLIKKIQEIQKNIFYKSLSDSTF